MARTKQAEPLRRNPSSEYTSKADANGTKSLSSRNLDKKINGDAPVQNGVVKGNAPLKEKAQQKEAGALQLIFAVAGIYGSFLTWALLQETTYHHPIWIGIGTGEVQISRLSQYMTSGVAVFTLHAGSGHSKPSKATLNPDRNTSWGLLLLGVNLLFDGLTNTTQDWIFQTFQPYKGPQMMCANNIMSTLLTMSYLLLSPYLVHTGLGEYLGMDLASGAGELAGALAFMQRHPGVWRDVLGFAACGAVGQVFIFYTLSTFSSLLLVTITVTRKMLTMILSVVWFGHKLGGKQWAGVGLVFGGIGAEAIIARREKAAKEQKKLAEKKKAL
ncbi:hypothetical protein EYC84_007444 [Monilinia fructicola]|uniref:UDP-galactose transporter homolog 1 n=1 Tax=Monilinia fructicola TaxID=38448 RepID=A0A5M9JGL4_MONFR|nr:hypothetical protein EYC84_007444 [Monilinia fructicola]